MKLSQVTKPVSYLQAHAPNILQDLADGSPGYLITDGGEARAVILDIRVYEALQDGLALLKILSLSSQHAREGKVSPAEQVFDRLRDKLFREAAQ